MPAIDLTRLRIQSEKLSGYIAQPDQFLAYLKEILDGFSNHTLRYKIDSQIDRLPSYRTPRPVLTQIELQLQPVITQFPEQAVNLIPILWSSAFRETRLLSAWLIGILPPLPALSLFSYLPAWLRETRDPEIRNALLTQSLARLRKENPQALIKIISGWLNAPGSNTQSWGLHALTPLIRFLGYNDLPKIFEILEPAILAVSPSTFMDIHACLSALYSISPMETAHYISSLSSKSTGNHFQKEFARLIRKLPPSLQSDLSRV